MKAFCITTDRCDEEKHRNMARDPASGAYVSFEGWIRNHHLGKRVHSLEYEAYIPLALIEGQRVIDEAVEKFSLNRCYASHRVGKLFVGELAVIVSVSADHRDAAFAACRYIIDEIKDRVPIWKKEHYLDESSAWVLCQHEHGKMNSAQGCK